MGKATGAKVATPAPPVPKSGDIASPGKFARGTGKAANDPRFQRLMAQVQGDALKQKKHPAAAQKAAEAQAAAVPPANEKTAGAKADQVDSMQEAKAEAPKTDSFLAMLRAEIDKVMPKTLDDTQRFMAGGEAGQVTSAVQGGVRQSQQDATGPVEQAATAAPDPGGVPTRTPAPAPGDPAPAPGAVDASNAVPLAKPPAEVSQQKKADDADARMKDAQVTDAQLQKANDPRFASVVTAKGDVKAKAAAAPGQYRGAEQRILAAGIAGAAANGRTQLAGMALARNQGATQVKSRQQIAKERDEQRRKGVTDKIEGIYQKTRTSVEAKLASLETDVMAAFDVGMNAALSGMKTFTDAEIQRFKDERYAGASGKLRWIADLFLPVPEGIKTILRQAKARFTGEMDALAVKVSTMVDTRVAAAKAEIQAGQSEITSYVATLPSDLRSVGRAAQNEVQGRFKELEDGIEAKKQSLAQGLAAKYKEANDRADAELKKIEEANEGTFKKFADQLEGVLKVIAEFKAKLMAILRKGEATIKLIIADPIGFLGNLIAAVKGGVMAFVGNFKSWLLKGLAQWLFGSLAQAGISMPADLSLPSIFKLVMQLLGISYASIRAKVVKLIGEPAVKAIETIAEFVQVFISGGPAALWAHIKEQLSDLKSMVIDAVIGWVTQTIITQASTKLLSMLNPAGAFVQACIGIYNVVMFLVERASQIVAFIEAVINSVHAIATGSIGGAIAWIEAALGRTVPLVISFLARLIGLGGITQKIVSIIKAVQAKVDKGIDWVIAKVVNGLKKLLGKVGGLFKKKDERTPEEKQRDLDKAVRDLKPKVAQFLKKGPSRAVLRIRLMLWKREHRLTSLALQGGQVVATINPTAAMYTAEEKQVGAALEPILLAAEQRYLNEVMAPKAGGSRQKVARARRQIRQGQSLDQRLNQNEMAITLRDARSQQVPLTNVASPTRGKDHQILTTAAIQGYDSRITVNPKTNDQSFSGMQNLYVTTPGKNSGPNYYGNWTGTVETEASQGRFTPEIRGLRDHIEVARAPGQLAANRVAHGLVDSGLATEHDITSAGRSYQTKKRLVTPKVTGEPMSGMAGYGTAQTADADFFDGEGGSKDARAQRQGAITVIFQRLRAAIAGHEPIVQGPEGDALRELGRAFERWCKSTLNGTRLDTSKARNAANDLAARLTQFLRATRPSS